MQNPDCPAWFGRIWFDGENLILEFVQLKFRKKQMPTRITQIENPKSETPALKIIGESGDQPDSTNPESVLTVYKVEGALHLKDAELLEKICLDVGNQTKRPVTLELSELCYLDSDSAGCCAA